jgi:hypothetical protein
LGVCCFGISLRCKDSSELRGEALRCLLYLFERDEALPLIGAG